MESFGTLLTSHGTLFEFNIFFISSPINMLIIFTSLKTLNRDNSQIKKVSFTKTKSAFYFRTYKLKDILLSISYHTTRHLTIRFNFNELKMNECSYPERIQKK